MSKSTARPPLGRGVARVLQQVFAVLGALFGRRAVTTPAESRPNPFADFTPHATAEDVESTATRRQADQWAAAWLPPHVAELTSRDRRVLGAEVWAEIARWTDHVVEHRGDARGDLVVVIEAHAVSTVISAVSAAVVPLTHVTIARQWVSPTEYRAAGMLRGIRVDIIGHLVEVLPATAGQRVAHV